MDICLRVLKESNKSRFDSYSVRNNVLSISHITFRNCRLHIFSDNLSRNSCIRFCLLSHSLWDVRPAVAADVAWTSTDTCNFVSRDWSPGGRVGEDPGNKVVMRALPRSTVYQFIKWATQHSLPVFEAPLRVSLQCLSSSLARQMPDDWWSHQHCKSLPVHLDCHSVTYHWKKHQITQF